MRYGGKSSLLLILVVIVSACSVVVSIGALSTSNATTGGRS